MIRTKRVTRTQSDVIRTKEVTRTQRVARTQRVTRTLSDLEQGDTGHRETRTLAVTRDEASRGRAALPSLSRADAERARRRLVRVSRCVRVIPASESSLYPGLLLFESFPYPSSSLIRVSPLSESLPYPSRRRQDVALLPPKRRRRVQVAGSTVAAVTTVTTVRPLQPLQPLQPSHARPAGRGDAARGAGNTATVT